MTNSNGGGRDDPVSSVEQQDTPAIRPAAGLLRPTVGKVSDDPEAGTLHASQPDMTNWANTALTTESADEPASLTSAEAFREHPLGVSHADESSHGDDASTDETDVSSHVKSINVEATSNGEGFYPMWRTGGNVVCVDDPSRPSWASGAYLKETKSDCCEAYSMLRVNECLSA